MLRVLAGSTKCVRLTPYAQAWLDAMVYPRRYGATTLALPAEPASSGQPRCWKVT
jgi:hypothetical protein